MAREGSTVRGVALRLLSRREHSRGELRRKLREKFGAEMGTTIETTLDDLEGSDLLSDGRFARAYARSVAERHGRRRIEAELRRRGVGDDDIAAALAEVGAGEEDAELARARALVARRRRTGKEADGEALRREEGRLLRWLLARGFSFQTARKALESTDDSEE